MPILSWYRNEELLSEGGRVRIVRGDDGRHSLTVLQTKPNDFGVYKCVARNKYGTVTCRARMLCGGETFVLFERKLKKLFSCVSSVEQTARLFAEYVELRDTKRLRFLPMIQNLARNISLNYNANELKLGCLLEPPPG